MHTCWFVRRLRGEPFRPLESADVLRDTWRKGEVPSCLGLCLAGGSSLFPPFECCPVRLGAPKTRARNMAADTTISGLSLPVRRRFSRIFPKFFTKILLDISLIAPHLSTARCGIETVSTLIYSPSFVRGFIFFDKFFDKNSLKSDCEFCA